MWYRGPTLKTLGSDESATLFIDCLYCPGQSFYLYKLDFDWFSAYSRIGGLYQEVTKAKLP